MNLKAQAQPRYRQCIIRVMQAKRVSGIDLVVEYSGLKEHLQNADLVITGEGQTDAQTLYGKLPLGIAHLARSYSVPCVCLSGALGLGYQSLYDEGMIGIFRVLIVPCPFKWLYKREVRN